MTDRVFLREAKDRASARVSVEQERRALWRECAIRASVNFLTLDQPAQLADAVLAAYDAKFLGAEPPAPKPEKPDRKSTRLNSSH